jgi:iron(III) transport system substrate-binding protein
MKVGFLVAVFFWFIIHIGLSSAGADLIDEAKKEGGLVWYTSLRNTEADAMVNGFRAKYPFIEITQYRGGGGPALVSKILSEARAKQYRFDVADGRPETIAPLMDQGLVAKYCSPEREFYEKGLKDDDCYWSSINVFPHVLAYNTNLVRQAEVPRTYEDVLASRWTGKISVDTAAYDWLDGLILAWGEDKAVAYMRKLMALNPVLQRNVAMRVQLLGAGEFHLAFAYASHAEGFKRQGMPIDWVPLEPVPVQLQILLLSSKAARPNSAKLFIDFLLSKEAQQLQRSLHRIPSRMDVEPDPPRLFRGYKKISVPPKSTKRSEEVARLYRDIFGPP